MRLLIGIILFCIAAAGFFFWFTAHNPPQSQLDQTVKSEQTTYGPIKAGMELKQTHEISKGDDKVVIGNTKTQVMAPVVQLSKWKEVSMDISYPTGGQVAPVTQDNKIIWSEKDKDVYFQQIPKDPKIDGDKFEFDILLKKKPDTNIFTYNIDTENLDFYFQPPLNQEAQNKNLNCTETECKDRNGNTISLRPENVVGSYAAYYKDGKTGDYSRVGGKNYETGKAFHIYRPQIIDAAGKKAWAELKVDETAKTLSVVVDPAFLTSASYPVTVDPTFGYTTQGGTGYSICQMGSGTVTDYRRGTVFSPANDGTLSQISIIKSNFGVVQSSLTPVFLAVNQKDSGGAGIHGQIDSIQSTADYTSPTTAGNGETESYSLSQSVSSGTNYILNITGDCSLLSFFSSVGIYGDSTGGISYLESYASFIKESPWTESTTGTIKYSIYATYLGPKVKLKGGMNLRGNINLR